MAENKFKLERVYVEKPRVLAQKQLSQVIASEAMTSVLKVTSDLNIPQLLLEGPKTTEEIALAADVNPAYLFRLLRGLAAIGFYSYDSQTKLWSNTKSTELLTGYYKQVINHYVNPVLRSLHNFLPQVLEQEKSIFEVAGVTPFDFGNPVVVESFQTFMESCTRVYMSRLVGHLDLTGYESAVDIGGGYGTLLEYIRAENPKMKLANFDLPVNEEKSIEKLTASLAENFKFEGGNFFESVPSGYDVYILKNVLHDWQDDKCLVILKNIRNVISDSGLLLIIDFNLNDENNSGRYAKLDDVKMMVALNAENRTEKQHLELLKQSGFRLKKVKHDSERVSILYCVPEQA